MTTEPDAPLVARVAVEGSLPHLDRLFDYAVPDADRDRIAPGVRVRVRFAGKLAHGFVLEVAHGTAFGGRLATLERVTSPEVVLTEPVAALVRAVATHYGGTFSDVARLAVPPRHAATEAAAPPAHPKPVVPAESGVLAAYPRARGYLDALRAGRPVRAAWNPVPVHGGSGDWAAGLLDAVGATLASGRGAVVVVPDADALAVLAPRCTDAFGAGSFVTLTADLGPAARYRAFLAASRGHVRLVLGTRAAVFAPVRDLGLVVVWDDGHDALAEPRAPYPHAREVAALRASLESTALLLAGHARTAEVQALVEKGWLGSIAQPPHEARRAAPVVRVAADHDRALERDPDARAARLPHDVFATLRAALASGPVLLQVPRAGYVAAVACQGCRAPVRCARCGLPLRGEPGEQGLALVCAACGPLAGPWACPHCGDTRLRAPRVGVARTAEELGRAFPQTPVLSSWSAHRVHEVGAEPALVLATPGAEPRAAAGYAAAVLLDSGLLLARADLRAAEEALRRWLDVTARVRSAAEGGTVLLVGAPDSRAVQALVRVDPVGFAERELAERREAGFPPAARLVVLDGPLAALDELAPAWRGLPGVQRFGPADLGDDRWRLTLRAPLAVGQQLVDALAAQQAERSARKAPGPVRVRVDPWQVD